MNAPWVVVAALTLGLHVPLAAQRSVAPAALLEELPADTSSAVVALEGSLQPRPDVTHWRLLLNDAVLLDARPESPRAAVSLAIGLLLRRGDNLVTLQALIEDRLVGQWSRHIHRSAPQRSQRFAVLAQGEPDAGGRNREKIEALRAALTSTGLPAANIIDVATPESLVVELEQLANKTSSRDQVLLYYAGLGRLNLRNSEPELIFDHSEQSRWRAGDMLRAAANLPTTTMLLDISYENTERWSPSVLKGSAQSTATAAPWLQTIGDTGVELAYSNPFNFAAHATGQGFTDDFVRELTAIGSSPCKTFASVTTTVVSQNAKRPDSSWPLYYTSAPGSSFRFCPDTPERLSALAIEEPGPTSPPDVLTIRLPSYAAGSGLAVDGVAVPTEQGRDVRRVAVGPGRHFVETIPAQGDLMPSLGVTTGAAVRAVAASQGSEELTAAISPTPEVTSDSTITLSFLSGDQSNASVAYQLRNNGVVVARDTPTLQAGIQRRQVAKRISLGVGTNNLVLEVTNGKGLAYSRAEVVRRQARAVRAVVVGVDEVRGAPVLKGAVSDAHRIRNLLLRFTDAASSDIQFLPGPAATRDAVRAAIQNVARSPRGSDETFVFYIAGYGRTVSDDTGNVRRCILLADYDPARPADCLSTVEIDTALDAVGRAVVIADTSYDGPAGPGSRTYRQVSTADASWRLTSGTERPDRVLVVASTSNTASREENGQGRFTRALADAVESSLAQSDGRSLSELPLLEAFERARVLVSAASRGEQVPVIKGVLASPFVFVHRIPAELRKEADGIVQATRLGVVAMRATDSTQLRKAIALYDTLLAINRNDHEAFLGRQRALVQLGEVEWAERELRSWLPDADDSKVRAAALATLAEARMRKGDLTTAVADLRTAVEVDTSQPAHQVQLGLLLLAIGEYQQALTTLQPILKATPGASLGDEDLGRVMLHTYLAFRLQGQHSDGKLLLQNFEARLRGSDFFRALYQNRLARKLFPARSQIAALGDISILAPWPNVVAQFLRDRGNEAAMRRFLDDAFDELDPRDRSAFNCLLNFYVGMSHTFEKRTVEARNAFAEVLKTARVDYAEYWIARHQLEQMR